MVWTYFAIAVNLFVCGVVAVPTQNDIAKSFQAAVHHQDLQSILMSIEERLRNLDSIYSMHLSPTLEDKLEQYQRKLESIDTKIIRLESLVMLNLDKISENISTKNFKDDIAKTNLVKKVDGVYEGISHRLNYIDRKLETTTNKIQGKLEATVTRLEKMDDSFTRKNEDIEIELSDAITAIDDLKTSQSVTEENILNNTNEIFEVNLKEQMLLMQSFNDKSNKAIATLYANATRDFGRFEESIGEGLKVVNETDRFLKSLKLELKRELNEYAVKVGEMNSENWKTGTILQNKQTSLETILNSTKTEIQNGLRALMVLIGKISNKEPPQSDESQINKLNEKIDSNFEKVFFAQNLFMDSCYRLQMDESQIESKISDILEKLIETFEQKTAIEIKDIKNLEKVIKNHDGHVTRNLHQANTNIVSLYEKMTQGHRQFDGNLKKVTDHLNALFSLIQDTLADENGALSSKNVNLLLRDLKEMEKKISSLYRRSDDITSSVEEIKGIVEGLDRGNSTEMIDEYFKNISRIIAGMEAKVNTAYLYYYYNRSKIDAINQNLTQKLGEVTDAIKDNMGSSNDGVESSTTPESTENKRERTKKLIAQIFGKKAEANDTTPTERSLLTNCDPDMQSIIDVRSNFDCETQTELQETTEHLEAKTTVKQPEEDEYEEANLQQVAV